MSKIQIDLEDVVRLEADGKTFVFNPDAEDSIDKLFQLKNQIEDAIQNIASEIKKQGEDINPNFKGVRGTKIQASNRYYGSEFKLDPAVEPTDIDPKYVTKSVRYMPNTEALKSLPSPLPKGIIKIKREKQISIKPIDK
jgi:hypothetical protein